MLLKSRKYFSGFLTMNLPVKLDQDKDRSADFVMNGGQHPASSCHCYMQIAECYRYLGKYQEAINSCKTCFQHGPDRAMLSEQCTNCLVQAAQITAYLGVLRGNLSSF